MNNNAWWNGFIIGFCLAVCIASLVTVLMINDLMSQMRSGH